MRNERLYSDNILKCADCKTAEVKDGKCPFCGKIMRNEGYKKNPFFRKQK